MGKTKKYTFIKSNISLLFRELCQAEEYQNCLQSFIKVTIR